MNFPPIYVVWVVREGRPYYVGTALEYDSAVRIGETTVSTRDYMVSKHVQEPPLEEECCDTSCSTAVCPAPAEATDFELPLDASTPEMDQLLNE